MLDLDRYVEVDVPEHPEELGHYATKAHEAFVGHPDSEVPPPVT